ncbi:oligosaccharide flippase family protein [Desulfohalobiaceae bacterium Ax17]|uniref:oligosaccharide flippase family protein n=1 Tax=Desulfovulcanus ferrireducens TaxID=2831190 RepID=UPI00207B9CA4|nr:oligosaccharide flippase family protein [Desulfovulcanus ferrireducens]MBT8764369.1 oligosaccharide flippase family protein [Desulfovulcanus ferrireducens]
MNKFFRNNILVLFLMNSGNVFNYLFQLVIGRSLTPEEFGVFNALNSLTLLASAPIAVIPFVFSKVTVQLSLNGLSQIRSLFWKSIKWLALISCAGFGIGLLALPATKGYLHIDSFVPILIILVQICLSLFRPVNMGILQGLQRFLGFGLAGSLTSIGRLLGGVVLVFFLGWGVNGALLSGLIGVVLTILISLLFLKDIVHGTKGSLPSGIYKGMGKYAVPVFFNTSMVMALGNLDLVLVRHYCLPAEAGLYATAAVLGRIGFFLPGVLVMVLFPAAAKAYSAGKHDNQSLWTCLGLTAFLSGSFALVCSLWPAQIISLLFGSPYAPAADLFRLVSISMSILALANVFFVFFLARCDYGFLWIQGVGLGLMLLLILMFHEHAIQIAWSLLSAIVFIFWATTIYFFLKDKKNGCIVNEQCDV